MKKYVMFLAALLALMLTLSACGAKTPEIAETPTPEPAPVETPAPTPESVTVVTGTVENIESISVSCGTYSALTCERDTATLFELLSSMAPVYVPDGEAPHGSEGDYRSITINYTDGTSDYIADGGDAGEKLTFYRALPEGEAGYITFADSAAALTYYIDVLMPPVSVDYAPEDADKAVFTEEGLENSEYLVNLILTAGEKVKKFSFFTLTMGDGTEGSVEFAMDEELYTRDAIEADKPIVIGTSFPGDMPSRGISYTDYDGEKRFFTISMSGLDGSIVLVEYRQAAD